MKYIIIIILNLTITACSLKTKEINIISQKKLYLESKKKLNNGNFKEAMKLLKKLKKDYPFNPYKEQIEINNIYIYYKLFEFKKAIKIIKKFILLKKNHPNMDYILYMYGLINEKLEEKNIIEKIFKINTLYKDPKHYLIALKCFNKINKFYKNSLYIKKAKKKIKYIKEYLVKNEISIIEYYFKRNAYIAVINRVKNTLKKYPNTKYTQELKKYVELSYKKLNIECIIKNEFLK